MVKTSPYSELLDHLDAFYLMTRAVAMLGTQASEEFNRDASVLIDFIGKVYDWPQERIESALSLILGEMMRIGLMEDYLALSSVDLLDDIEEENMILYEIKGRAIEEVNRSEIMASSTDHRVEHELKSKSGYIAFHHVYEPRLRFAQIKRSAEGGDIIAMWQESLMLILGIGCRSDIAAAQRLLQNMLIWGEKSAAAILCYLWNYEGDSEMCSFYLNVFDLLDQNRFFSFEDEERNFRDNAEEYCILITSVRSVIILGCGRKEVDMLFADLINREDIGFSEKIDLIRSYKDSSWLTKCLCNNRHKLIGFLNNKNNEGGIME